MSKFFYVSFYNDIVIDDSQTSQQTGWSSQKILDKIIEYRITKLESLSDVDVSTKKDKQVLIYSQDMNKFTTMDIGDISQGSGLSLQQRNIMGAIGTEENPQEVDLEINTVDFKMPQVNVLKFVIGDENVIKTLNTFSNSENTSFQTDDYIELDDTAHLKTTYDNVMQYERDLDNGTEVSCNIDKSIFKSIDSFEDNTDGVDNVIQINAIPFDRILTPLEDINLSYVENIDYFNIAGQGNNLKIICSIDSGTTWNTFNTDHWENIDFTIEAMKSKGITLSVFNAINSTYWNLLNTNKKIRFAYLLSMDDINDNENVDNLNLQYDGQGKWIQAKESEYDVAYASNSILQVFLKITGDVKINY